MTLADAELMHMIRKGAVEHDRRNMPGAAILFVGWIDPDVFLDLAYPTGKICSITVPLTIVTMLDHIRCGRASALPG